MREDVTFKDFRRVMTKRKRTVSDMATEFKGKIDEPTAFFDKVMAERWHGADLGGVVIPYRSVLSFYFIEKHYLDETNSRD